MVVTTALAVAAAVVTPFSGTPNPTFTAKTFQLTVSSGKTSVRHVVAGPERFGSNARDAKVVDIAGRGNVLLLGATATVKGQRFNNRYQAAPDGVTGPNDLGLKLARFAVTEARAGKLKLSAERLANRDVLRGEIDLPANDCLKLAEGTATIWLTKTTLLPKRLEVERDGVTTTYRYRFSGFNQDLSLSSIGLPKLGSRPTITNNGFKHRTPAEADGPLAFTPRLPTKLPTGFTLASSGWAPQGAKTGVGGINKRNRSLFSAVYTKGWERIEITERLVGSSRFVRDPFSVRCLAMQPGRTLVSNRAAKYGIGTEIPSHLWFREGGIYVTVSGPYPKNDLKAIAESLQKITT
jgi:hypothetical protein